MPEPFGATIIAATSGGPGALTFVTVSEQALTVEYISADGAMNVRIVDRDEALRVAEWCEGAPS